MSIRAVYPGSFDPVTNGHMDIITRAARIFDGVTIAILENPVKEPLFTVAERRAMLLEATGDIPGVYVDVFNGLLVDYVRKHGTRVIIKGLRVVSDFEYEVQMALTNRELYPKAETFFLAASSKYSFLSSSVVKELAQFGGDISDMVPEPVKARLEAKFSALRSSQE